jgi:ABC-type sugar transport system substrate-binding protein
MAPFRRARKRTLGLGAVTATAGLIIGLAGCASVDAGGDAGSTNGSGSGSKEVVAFVPPTTDPYVANYLKYAGETLGDAGYTLRSITQETSSAGAAAVQQVLGSGSLPAAFIWWPIEPEAQLGSLSQLSESGVPVFQTNQLPVAGSEDLLTAFAGVSDLQAGKIAADASIAARDELKANGATLSSEGGGILVPNFPVGYGATRDRLAGLEDGIEGSGLEVVAAGNAAGFAAQDAFTLMNEMIAANRAKGFDIVYAPNDDVAIGSIRALTQAGYTPGKDVMVIGGACHGDDSAVLDGTQYNTIIQGSGLEGMFTADRILAYIANPEVKDGEYLAPDDAEAMPELPAEISKINLIPLPYVLAADYESAELWGQPAKDWCTY